MSSDYSFYWAMKDADPSQGSQYPRSRAPIGNEPRNGDRRLFVAEFSLTALKLEVIEEG